MAFASTWPWAEVQSKEPMSGSQTSYLLQFFIYPPPNSFFKKHHFEGRLHTQIKCLLDVVFSCDVRWNWPVTLPGRPGLPSVCCCRPPPLAPMLCCSHHLHNLLWRYRQAEFGIPVGSSWTWGKRPKSWGGQTSRWQKLSGLWNLVGIFPIK